MTEDQMRNYEQGVRLRLITPVILWLYERNLVHCFGVDKTNAFQEADKAREYMRKANRKTVREFVGTQIKIFQESAELANPKAKESSLSFATRRLSLLSELLREFSDCPGADAIMIVNAYMNADMEDTQELLALAGYD